MMASLVLRISASLLACLALVSCGGGPKAQWLMPTPAMYLSGDLHPFAHLRKSDQTSETEVFYATNRHVEAGSYGAGLDETLRFGVARMALGEEGEHWKELVDASTHHPRKKNVPVRLLGHEEAGVLGSPGARNWLAKVDGELRKSETRDIVIYVHGAKVGFEHSCAFAAELKHFCGRDMTAIAFDWPTHRELVSYVDGVDLSHARHSSVRLKEMIDLLASETSARRIHIVSWSAGARVLLRALHEMGGSDPVGQADRYRLGVVVFAAGDVPEKDFEKRLPATHGLSERVIVYVSDDDFALRWSSRLMGGGQRLGTEWDELTEERRALLKTHRRLEIVDTSYGKSRRGFDIRGHRYWFQHPWVNSDVMLALRTDRPASERGLSRGESPGLFYFAPDYGERIGKVARELTGGNW